MRYLGRIAKLTDYSFNRQLYTAHTVCFAWNHGGVSRAKPTEAVRLFCFHSMLKRRTPECGTVIAISSVLVNDH